MLNKLRGGKGDKLNPKNVDHNELKKGIKHEMEHTSSSIIAKEIALDHLAEDPKYYSRLEKAGIDEIKRMQQLACIQLNELEISNPNVKIPEGWDEIILEPEDIKEDIVYWFSAPMDGHDENHTDTIQITNSKDNKFIITTYYAFGNAIKEPIKYSSINLALKRAYEIMLEISDDWDDDDDDDEKWEDDEDLIDELEVNHPLTRSEVEKYIRNVIDVYYEDNMMGEDKNIEYEFNEDHLWDDDEQIEEYNKIFNFLKGKKLIFNDHEALIERVKVSTDEYGSIIIKWTEPDLND